MQPSKNVLGFDFGEKRIGVALGDSLTKIVHPLQTIETEINSERFHIINGLLEKWKPDYVVIGIPFNDDGTSAEAESILRERGVKIKENKGLIDQFAAKIILESFFREYID